jgi:hypothetical protein
MNNRNSVRAAAVGALAVVVLVVSACAADVRPGAAGTGPDPAGSSSSAGMGAVGDPAAAGTSNAAGDPATARTSNSAGTPSAASSLTAGRSSTADPASADTRAGVEGSRTAPPINKSPSPTPSAGSGPGSSSSGRARIPAGLDGLRFGSVTATGRALVPGKPLIIEFSAGRVFLNAGCNSAAGEPVFAGSTLAVRHLITTEMACGGARGGTTIMDQESWFQSWLIKGVGWKLDGTALVLSGHGVTVTFARQGPANRTDSSAGPGSTTATSTMATRTTGSGTHPNSAGPGSSDADQPTAATTVTVVRPQPPSPGLTMPPKTQRPGDSIPVQPTR